MNQQEIIQDHLRVCDDVHQCVLEENRFLRQHQRAPSPALIERKTALRGQLDANVAALRELPGGLIRDPEMRARIERTRSRILQILQLERENEQLLLRCSLAAPRAASATPASNLVQKIYGGSGTCRR